MRARSRFLQHCEGVDSKGIKLEFTINYHNESSTKILWCYHSTISAMAWLKKKVTRWPLYVLHTFFQLKCRGLTSNDQKWGFTLEFHGLKTAWFPPEQNYTKRMAAMSRAAWAQWIHHWHGGRPSFPPENRQWSARGSWTHFLVAQPIWGSSRYLMGRHLMVAKQTLGSVFWE